MSYAADEGTAAHMLAQLCLVAGLKDQEIGADAADYVGQKLTISHYKHAELGASSAHRWTVCTASVKEQGPDLTPIGPGATFEVTDEMAEAVQVYLDAVRAKLKELGPTAKLYVEESFDLGELYAGMAGSCDAVIVQPMGQMWVYDYKHGAGHVVEVEDNTQMKFYGCGAIEKFCKVWETEEVHLTIVQPRAFHKDGRVRSWAIDPMALVKWGIDVLRAKAIETDTKPKHVAGDHCKYCRAAGTCPEIRKQTVEVAMTVFSPVNDQSSSPALVPPEKLTNDQLGRIKAFRDMVDTWMDGVDAECFNRAKRGDPPTNWKLIETTSKGHRKWINEKEVVDAIKNPGILYEKPELKSPAQMEKALKAAGVALNISSLTQQTTTKNHTLVPISDPRPAISVLAFTPVAPSSDAASFLD